MKNHTKDISKLKSELDRRYNLFAKNKIDFLYFTGLGSYIDLICNSSELLDYIETEKRDWKVLEFPKTKKGYDYDPNQNAMTVQKALNIWPAFGIVFLPYKALKEMENFKDPNYDWENHPNRIKVLGYTYSGGIYEFRLARDMRRISENYIAGNNLVMKQKDSYKPSIEKIHNRLMDRLSNLRLATAEENQIKPDLSLKFDKENSVLHFKGHEIIIKRKSDNPYDHYILVALFDQEDVSDTIEAKDIAINYLDIQDYDSSKDWNKIRHACDNLNKKVDKATKGKFKAFVLYTTGKTAWCKINPKCF